MEELFGSFARGVAALIDLAAVLIVAYGCAEGFIGLLGCVLRPGSTHGARKAIWRRLGTWLVLGLEFQLAADIVASVISPTWRDIGQLGAIAVIRTFLNFFLEMDLEGAPAEESVTTTRGEILKPAVRETER